MKFLALAILTLLGSTSAQGCRPAKTYAQSAVQALSRSIKCPCRFSCKCSSINVDVADRFAKLWEINSWITSQDWYIDAVTAIIREFPKMTLNHVAQSSHYDENEKAGLLPTTAQVCLRYGNVDGAGPDDIRAGLGYYHFNRISVATMTSAPNFPLVPGKVEYFVSPLILFERHFIACGGNIAMNHKCPGKMESRDLGKHEKIKKKALKALAYLHKMLARQGGPKIANEVAIFGGVTFNHICKTVSLSESRKFTKVNADDLRSTIECNTEDIAHVLEHQPEEIAEEESDYSHKSAEEEDAEEEDAEEEDAEEESDYSHKMGFTTKLRSTKSF